MIEFYGCLKALGLSTWVFRRSAKSASTLADFLDASWCLLVPVYGSYGSFVQALQLLISVPFSPLLA
jgi:hypothetical protein